MYENDALLILLRRIVTVNESLWLLLFLSVLLVLIGSNYGEKLKEKYVKNKE